MAADPQLSRAPSRHATPTLVLILDRTAAIERIVAHATDPRVPEQFMLRVPADPPAAAFVPRAAAAVASPAPLAADEREPSMAGAYHVVPLW